MTEVEIMKDMECCTEHNCGECSRSASITNGCVNRLLMDALGVIKLQKSAIENGNKTIDSLMQKVAEYESATKARLKMSELISSVNVIIENSFDSEDCGDYIGCLIESIQKMLKLLGLDGAYIAFSPFDKYPQIKMGNKK